MIKNISEEMYVSKQTIRHYLCLYLVYQDISVLAPKQKKEKELSDREAVITRKELMAEAKNTLVEKKLPVSLAEVLNYADADTCNKSISAVEKAFQEAVEAAVNERLKGGTPPKKAPQENVTKETYAKMGYTERLKLKTENPELYKQLAGK